jgi:hypothetical protein
VIIIPRSFATESVEQRKRSRQMNTRVARHPAQRACLAFLCAVALVALPAPAYGARPPEEDCKKGAAMFELAPWLALGGGVRRERDGHQRALGTVAMDAAVTIPVFTNLRVGAWASPGTVNFSSFDVVGGGRIELQTNELAGQYSNLFKVSGRWSLILDGGVGKRFGPSGNRGEFFVARIAAGFTAPNLLYNLYQRAENCRCEGGPIEEESPGVCRPNRGVIAGARPYVMLHRAFDASRTEVTAGLEFEVIGAGWWLLGGL